MSYCDRCALTTQHRERIDQLSKACALQNDEVCQTLGKALGYPWFKDDQANFPGADESNGVCVGEHVAESIAEEAARRITQADARVRELETQIEREVEAGHGLADESNAYADRIAKLRAIVDPLRALAAKATRGEWYVSLGNRQERNGKRYGCEVSTRIPLADQKPWQSSGYVPLAEIRHPSNPSSVDDPRDLVTEERLANAALIVAAINALPALLRLAEPGA